MAKLDAWFEERSFNFKWWMPFVTMTVGIVGVPIGIPLTLDPPDHTFGWYVIGYLWLMIGLFAFAVHFVGLFRKWWD